MDNDDFTRKLLEAFAVEADEHLKEMTAGLLELEKNPSGDRQKTLIETTFREAHSLKGAARAVNRADVEAVCQALEGVMAIWKRAPRPMAAEEFDILNSAIDVVSKQLTDPTFAAAPQGQQEARAIIAKLRALETSPAAPEPAARPTPPPPTPPSEARKPEPVETEKFSISETVRVPVAKMNTLLRKAEGMIGVKLATQRYAAELREVGTLLDTWRAEWKHARPAVGAEEKAGGAASAFLGWNREFMERFDTTLRDLARSMETDERAVSAAVDDLLADAKQLLLLPFAILLDPLPKQVRDLSREQGKEVDLVIRGREVEIDKRILDEMKDALVHLVRNAIDHGLEKPGTRIAAGKGSRGKLSIAVSRREGNRVSIRVSDDGEGINVEKVKAVARRHGELSEAEAGQLDRDAAMALIFQSGLSTAPIVTDLSGRGLGMAIVREKVERLGGQIAIESQLGAGTTFHIVLPVTLATFKGIVVSAAGQTFVIPSSGVDQIGRVPRSAIRTVENRPTISWNDRVVSLAVLAEVLELNGGKTPQKNEVIEVVILGAGEKRVAFVVDEVLTEQEVLVKPLAKPLVRVRNVSSAAVLGSGTPVLILNVSDLLKSAGKLSAGARFAAGAVQAEEAPAQRVLVADDSVTSRMLIKNILESAGYEVATAVDGAEALGALQRGAFDILVSDVEMPRLNGFELTAKVRADKKLGELPVILVTALGSPEDRDRGIDAGANAYIVKSTFDQNNLIEIMKRLIA